MPRADESSTPVELRFIDLFLLVIAALIFVALVLMLQGAGNNPPLAIQTKSLPDAVVGHDYELALAASGGEPPLEWCIVEGALPAGFVLDGDVLRGKAATVIPPTPCILEVRDSKGEAQRSRLIFQSTALTSSDQEDKPRFVGTSIRLGDGQSEFGYAAQLQAVGGVPPYRWSRKGGVAPDGLTLSPAGGFRGTPQVAPPSPYRLVFSTQAERRAAKRSVGTYTFDAEVRDGNGAAATQRVNLYVEPTRYSLFWQLMTGDLPSDTGLSVSALSLLLRVALFVVLTYLLWILILPILMLMLGFVEQEVPGWRGLARGPDAGAAVGSFPVRPLVPFAVSIRKLINAVSGVIVFSGIFLAAAWGIVQGGRNAVHEGGPTAKRGKPPEPTVSADESEPAPRERKSFWRWLLELFRADKKHERRSSPARGSARKRLSRGSTGSTNGSQATNDSLPNVRNPGLEPSRTETAYVQSLRLGGRVRLGGSFLALPFLAKTGLPDLLATAFRPLPAVGQGLSQAALDAFFAALLNVRRADDARRRPDKRFDVVQGRLGPAVLPTDGDSASETRSKHQAPPRSNLELRWPDEAESSSDARATAMSRAALRARRWLLVGLSSPGGSHREARRLLRRLLRSTVHIRLEDHILVVRVNAAASKRGSELIARLLSRLNQAGGSMLGPCSYRVSYCLEAEPRTWAGPIRGQSATLS